MIAEQALPYLEAEAEVSETLTDASDSATLVINEAPIDPGEAQILRAVEQCGAFDFWLDPSEDCYTLEDGEPA